MKQLVYIAGPYTKGDVAVNVKEALNAADYLAERGYLAYVPHLSHFWHIISPKPWRFWIELDTRILPYCSALLRLPGKSEGADGEVELAEQFSIPVFYSVSELVVILPKHM